MSALQSFANVFNVPDLRKRVLFTFLLLAVYRLGAHIPTPGVDPQAINAFFKASAAKGVLVSDVGDDADAHEALRGDVITALDGEPVHSVLELADRAGAHAATKPVRLSLRRGARDLTISFPLR